jgi:hypothetical protein
MKKWEYEKVEAIDIDDIKFHGKNGWEACFLIGDFILMKREIPEAKKTVQKVQKWLEEQRRRTDPNECEYDHEGARGT